MKNTKQIFGLVFLLSALVAACGYVVVKNETPSQQKPEASDLEKPDNSPQQNGGNEPYQTGLVHPPEGWQTDAPFDEATTMETLPAYYNWNDYFHLQPIRNQGGCGSCWSFATVATVESLMKIVRPMQYRVDLSEQHLVSSCCNEGTCAGGFFTAYNCIKIGVPDEQEVPYLARNSGCKQNVKPVASITRWSYVGDRSRGATTDQIKAAILKHGPVSVDVNGSGSFQGYRSGVFTSCGSTGTNHMVVLDGWVDDDKYKDYGGGYWLMRNSWGTNWGEQGYMKIVYKSRSGKNCNGIGNYAAYAVLDNVEDLQDYLGMK